MQAFGASTPLLTVTEVATAAGLDRGTAFRLIHTLLALGYLRSVPPRRFQLTLKCLELGFLALSAQDLPTHARPLLEACVPSIADAASLGALDGPDVVYLERIDSGRVRRDLDRRPGRRLRAYGAALGHSMLAFLPEAEQIAILQSAERVKLAEHTLVDLDALLERLRLVRTRGYAVSDGENAYGLRTVATAILDAAGVPVAGVSLTVDSGRMSLEEFVAAAAPRAIDIAAELSRGVRLSAGTIGVRSAH